MARLAHLPLILLAGSWCAPAQFMPLKEVHAGMRGAGKTVFSGVRIEEFQVEVLGVLDNVGPKQSIILARLSGGPLDKTGVMQGMSGSPVYIGGRLAGAVAMAFPYAKEPIAGIRPIEEMLRAAEPAAAPAVRARASLFDENLGRVFPRAEPVLAGGAKLIDIATPISFGGFTRGAIEHFAGQLRSLGLEPQQGMSGGGRLAARFGDPASLQPGSMISVQLVSGDMSIGADGTVTYIDGRRVYAFGHRFLAIGSTDLPFARAEVLTLLPTLSSSFKISTPREWMGAITTDRSVTVSGELGRRAPRVPVAIDVAQRPAAGPARRSSYRLEMVDDSFLAPFLLQMVIFSAIDATERTVGASTFAMRGEIEFQGGAAPIRLNNMFAGEANVPSQVSVAAAVPLAYAMQSGFSSLKLKNVALSIEAFDQKKQLDIGQVWAAPREVRPGEKVEIAVTLSGENGKELTRRVSYQVPVGAPPGPLYFTVADGNTTNLTEYRQFIGVNPRSVAQLVSFLNALRGNTKAYVRVWRADPNFQVEGEDLPAPPPSLALMLARAQPSLGGLAQSRNSKVAEMEIGAGDTVISGSKTVQVEVKE